MIHRRGHWGVVGWASACDVCSLTPRAECWGLGDKDKNQPVLNCLHWPFMAE